MTKTEMTTLDALTSNKLHATCGGCGFRWAIWYKGETSTEIGRLYCACESPATVRKVGSMWHLAWLHQYDDGSTRRMALSFRTKKAALAHAEYHRDTVGIPAILESVA